MLAEPREWFAIQARDKVASGWRIPSRPRSPKASGGGRGYWPFSLRSKNSMCVFSTLKPLVLLPGALWRSPG